MSGCQTRDQDLDLYTLCFGKVSVKGLTLRVAQLKLGLEGMGIPLQWAPSPLSCAPHAATSDLSPLAQSWRRLHATAPHHFVYLPVPLLQTRLFTVCPNQTLLFLILV